jgi:hypothetical protein
MSWPLVNDRYKNHSCTYQTLTPNQRCPCNTCNKIQVTQLRNTCNYCQCSCKNNYLGQTLTLNPKCLSKVPTHATYQAIQFKWTCDYNGHNCNNYNCTKTLTLNNIFPYMKHLATCKSYDAFSLTINENLNLNVGINTKCKTYICQNACFLMAIVCHCSYINDYIGSLLLSDTWHVVIEIQSKPYP